MPIDISDIRPRTASFVSELLICGAIKTVKLAEVLQRNSISLDKTSLLVSHEELRTQAAVFFFFFFLSGDRNTHPEETLWNCSLWAKWGGWHFSTAGPVAKLMNSKGKRFFLFCFVFLKTCTQDKVALTIKDSIILMQWPWHVLFFSFTFTAFGWSLYPEWLAWMLWSPSETWPLASTHTRSVWDNTDKTEFSFN